MLIYIMLFGTVNIGIYIYIIYKIIGVHSRVTNVIF
jgi:hypothetical protein